MICIRTNIQKVALIVFVPVLVLTLFRRLSVSPFCCRVGYSTPQGTSDSALLLERSLVTCSNCTSFPSFGANFLSGDDAHFVCLSPGNCTAEITRGMTIASSFQFVIEDFTLSACRTPQVAGVASSCVSVIVSPSVIFVYTQFYVSPGDGAWLTADGKSRLIVSRSNVLFNPRVTTSTAPLAWPFSSATTLSYVAFSCPRQSRCEFHDPQISIDSAYHVLFTNLHFRACHSSHCLVIMRSLNITIQQSTFADATYPFVWLYDTHWSISQCSFSDLNTTTYAPSQVVRFWFPDWYQ